jgi:nucleoside-diphosphate-sugar epimerase
MKTVLIVGGTSTVGIAAGRLLAQNYNVFYAGRQQADYLLDLNSPDLIFPDNLQFDIVVHTAADFGGNEELDFCRAEQINVIGTLNVCRLAKKVQAEHLIIISSIFANYTSSDAYYSIYSLSKKHADELAQLFCHQFNLALTILRPSQLYDAEGNCRKHQGLFYSIIDKAQHGEDIIFYGINDALRNYLFLDDFSEIIASVIRKKVTGLFNCPAQKSVHLNEIAQTAYSAFNQHGTIQFLENKPDIPDIPVISDGGFYEQIGFKPRVNLKEGINKIRYIREMI